MYFIKIVAQNSIFLVSGTYLKTLHKNEINFKIIQFMDEFRHKLLNSYVFYILIFRLVLNQSRPKSIKIYLVNLLFIIIKEVSNFIGVLFISLIF